MLDYFLELLKSQADNGSFKTGCAVAGGLASYVVGGFDRSLQALFILIAADYLFGFSRAWVRSEISAAKMKMGIIKPIWVFGALSVVHQLDCALLYQAGDQMSAIRNACGNGALTLRNLVALYMCVHEALSALGHLHALGVRMPPWLLPRLRAFRDCKVFCDRPPRAKAVSPAGGGAQ